MSTVAPMPSRFLWHLCHAEQLSGPRATFLRELSELVGGPYKKAPPPSLTEAALSESHPRMARKPANQSSPLGVDPFTDGPPGTSARCHHAMW